MLIERSNFLSTFHGLSHGSHAPVLFVKVHRRTAANGLFDVALHFDQIFLDAGDLRRAGRGLKNR